jgi:hypothetical protein
MNRKAEEGGNVSGVVVALILVVLVVIIGYLTLYFFYSTDPLGIFPDFTPDENLVKYDGREKLLFPELVLYKVIEDGDEEGIAYQYSKGSDLYKDGWYWQLGVEEGIIFKETRYLGWVSVDRDLGGYKELSEENKATIEALRGKTPEDGLHILVRRAVADSGRGSVFGFRIGDNDGLYERYHSNVGVLKDVNGLIIRINQLSRGFKSANE